MSNLITGVIAVTMATVFFMFYPFRLFDALGFAKSLPIWIIIVVSLACLIYDFFTSIKEERRPPGK